MDSTKHTLSLALLLALALAPHTFAADRPTPPTRPAPVLARVLPDGAVPSPTQDGDFLLGPTHGIAPGMIVHPGVPRGRIVTFTMQSMQSEVFPGIARDPGTFGTVDPAHPERLLVTTSHPAPWSRRVEVYVPAGYVPGTESPFILGADGPDSGLFRALDNLIAEHRVPAMVAISIGNGGGDAQGSERGLEYDTMSGRYAEFIEREVLPRVEHEAGVTLTHDPDGRATMGGSSGGSAALIMAWYRPQWYHRVLMYSGTLINQQWPWTAATPHGAYAFPESLIADSPKQPLRIWMEVGDRDLLNPNVMRDGMHDWVESNERMAQALAARATTTSSSSQKTPATSTAPSNSKPCPRHSNTSGRATPQSRNTRRSRGIATKRSPRPRLVPRQLQAPVRRLVHGHLRMQRRVQD